MNTQMAHRPFLLLAALLFACSPAAASGPSASPRVTGLYVYQPTPYVWDLVRVVDGKIVSEQGTILEWSCSGKRWAVGVVPASIADGSLRFGDDRFAIASGVPAAPWRLGADPRMLAAPACGPVPTTKPGLSPDAARELIKQRVTGIGAVLVPMRLPDRVSAEVDARAESFTVTYAGAGVRITLATVASNPQPPQAGGSQRHLLFRGDARALYQTLDASPATSRTLLWNEETARTGSGAASIAYSLTSEGLSESEFWAIAESLR